MVQIQHTVYTWGSETAIADVEDPIREGEDVFYFSLKYQHPIHKRWETVTRVTDDVFPPDFILVGVRQRSRTIFLRNLGHPKYRLRSALPVALEVDGPHVVAYSHDLNMFGWGDVEDEALIDFKGAVCELYESLREDPAKLGPHLQETLRYLEQMITEGS